MQIGCIKLTKSHTKDSKEKTSILNKYLGGKICGNIIQYATG